MSDQEFKQLFEIHEVLVSGRIDQAVKMLEKFIGIDKPEVDNKIEIV